MNEFEFNSTKSTLNKDKHGIDFLEAQEVWQDKNSIQLSTGTIGEKRYLIVGQAFGKFWTVVITYRNDRIRIISARRARDAERRQYEESLTHFDGGI